MFQGSEREKQETQTLGSPTGCVCTSHGSWLELPLVGSVGKETKITASEQEVGKLLENSVKYERRRFTEQN